MDRQKGASLLEFIPTALVKSFHQDLPTPTADSPPFRDRGEPKRSCSNELLRSDCVEASNVELATTSSELHECAEKDSKESVSCKRLRSVNSNSFCVSGSAR